MQRSRVQLPSAPLVKQKALRRDFKGLSSCVDWRALAVAWVTSGELRLARPGFARVYATFDWRHRPGTSCPGHRRPKGAEQIAILLDCQSAVRCAALASDRVLPLPGPR